MLARRGFYPVRKWVMAVAPNSRLSRICCLPPLYASVCLSSSLPTAMFGRRIAIGLDNGQVMILSLDNVDFYLIQSSVISFFVYCTCLAMLGHCLMRCTQRSGGSKIWRRIVAPRRVGQEGYKVGMCAYVCQAIDAPPIHPCLTPSTMSTAIQLLYDRFLIVV